MDKIKIKQEPGLTGNSQSNKKPNLKPNLTSPIKTSKEKLNNSNNNNSNRPSTTSYIPTSSKPTSYVGSTSQARKLVAKNNNNIKPKNKSIPSSSSNSNVSNISNISSSTSRIQVKKEPGLVKSNNDPIKEKLSEFMVDLPDLNLKKKLNDENKNEGIHDVDDDDQDELSSKFSSPFNSRVDTAGTNLTFLTKATNAEISHKNSVSNRIIANHCSHLSDDNNNNKHINNLLSSELKIRDSSEISNDDHLNLLSSSPCINRKFKQTANDTNNNKRKIDTNKTLLKSFKKSKSRNVDTSNKENESFNSTEANDGSLNNDFEDDDDDDDERPKTPIKFKSDSKPIFEYMEGEDVIYYDIMGKNNENNKILELDDNEKQFFEYVHYNFDQWKEQNEIFINQYNRLMKNVINARIKFNKRFQFLRKNLDDFAINLENHGDKISKKSEILKEYCNKIVTEID